MLFICGNQYPNSFGNNPLSSLGREPSGAPQTVNLVIYPVQKIGVVNNVFIDHLTKLFTLRLPLPFRTNTIGAAKGLKDGSI